MPERPAEMDETDRIKTEPRYPYQAVAAAVAREVTDGTLLTEWGMLARHGRHELRVVRPAVAPQAPPVTVGSPTADHRAGTLLALAVRRRGSEVARFSTVADPASASELHEVLAAAVARAGGTTEEITEYEMDVRLPAEPAPMMTFVASSRTG